MSVFSFWEKENEKKTETWNPKNMFPTRSPHMFLFQQMVQNVTCTAFVLLLMKIFRKKEEKKTSGDYPANPDSHSMCAHFGIYNVTYLRLHFHFHSHPTCRTMNGELYDETYYKFNERTGTTETRWQCGIMWNGEYLKWKPFNAFNLFLQIMRQC